MIALLRLCGLSTTHLDFEPINLHLCGLKSGIDFVLEPECAYIWVGLYSSFYSNLKVL